MVEAHALGRFALVRWLTRSETGLAMDEAGRRVVLKILDQDCLLKGKLHPNVRDRLARVRELALASVANLHGVELVGGKAYLVWEFVEGKTFEEYARQCASAADLARMSREVVLAVQSMHAMGIVHGAIHGRNIIIDVAGKVRLIHVSPLLYDDPAGDAHNLIHCIRQAARNREWENLDLDDALVAAEGMDQPLRQLSHRLAAGKSVAMEADSGSDGRLRKRLMIGAVLVSVGGVAGSVLLWWMLRRSAPPALVPPQAPSSLTRS